MEHFIYYKNVVISYYHQNVYQNHNQKYLRDSRSGHFPKFYIPPMEYLKNLIDMIEGMESIHIEANRLVSTERFINPLFDATCVIKDNPGLSNTSYLGQTGKGKKFIKILCIKCQQQIHGERPRKNSFCRSKNFLSYLRSIAESTRHGHHAPNKNKARSFFSSAAREMDKEAEEMIHCKLIGPGSINILFATENGPMVLLSMERMDPQIFIKIQMV